MYKERERGKGYRASEEKSEQPIFLVGLGGGGEQFESEHESFVKWESNGV